MQKIVELGKEEKAVHGSGVPGTQTRGNKDTTNDDFGAQDQDWDVYRDIQKDGFSEDDEDDQQAMDEIEDKLGELDVDFKTIMYETGPGGHKPATAEDYQIRLWTDRYRGSEVLFQPSIVGLDCAGLTEALRNIMQQLNNSQKTKILKNVVILGGNSQVPGFDDRIRSELTMMANQGTQINIVNHFEYRNLESDDKPPAVDNRLLQPWLGAAKLAQNWQKTGTLSKHSMSKSQYEEFGSEYFKEHSLSNLNYAK